MRKKTRRTWKSRDIQAEAPLSWCCSCGRALYEGMKQDGFCSACRPFLHKKEAPGL